MTQLTEIEARSLFRRLHINKRNGYERGDCHCQFCTDAVDDLVVYFGVTDTRARAESIRSEARVKGWSEGP